MDAAKCEIFLRALDRGSLSRAAEELGYTPSGISRSIAALEDALDADRQARDIVFSRFG